MSGIFLAHISEDKPKVRQLRDRLRAEGFRTWMDEDNILAGQDWEKEIERIIPNAGLFLLCLSKKAISKRGFFQKEKKLGENAQMYMPDNGIFMIPIILDRDIEISEIDYRKYHAVYLHIEKDIHNLFKSIRTLTTPEQKQKIFMTAEEHEKELRQVKAQYIQGEFPKNKEEKQFDKNYKKKPKLASARKTTVPITKLNTDALPGLLEQTRWSWIPAGGLIKRGFWLCRFPITNSEYRLFVSAGGYQTKTFWSSSGSNWKIKKNIHGPYSREGFTNPSQPVVDVSWYECEAFCMWLSGLIIKEAWAKDLIAKLPTAKQWEYAARGKERRKYPWGENEPDHTLANFGLKNKRTTNVGRYPETEHGLTDMAGNVCEWCSMKDIQGAYKTKKNKIIVPVSVPKTLLLGGSWADNAKSLRSGTRVYGPENRSNLAGFRPCLVSTMIESVF